MARRSYNKQFKMATIKLGLKDNMSVSKVSKELDIRIIVCIDGLMNM